MGDGYVTYGNAQSLSIEELWHTYLHTRVIPNSSLHGSLETNWTAARAHKNADDLRRTGLGRLHAAPLGSATKGAGCTLIIRSDVPLDRDERTVYRHPEGKALAVHLTWHGIRLLVVLTHLPHTDNLQAAEYKRLQQDLECIYSTKDDAHPEDYDSQGRPPADRMVIWMADRNHIINPAIDCIPANAASANPQATIGCQKFAAYLRATVDAYRHLHPTTPAGTRHNPGMEAITLPNGKTRPATQATNKRLDVINISPGLATGEKRIVQATHVPAIDYSVRYQPKDKAAKTTKEADHDLVRIVIRTSNIPRPKGTPTLDREVMADEKGRTALRRAIMRALQSEGTAEVRQRELAAQCLEAGIMHRRAVHGAIRAKIGKTKRKLDQMHTNTRNATTAQERTRFEAEAARARRAYLEASAEQQDLMMRSHRRLQNLKDKETNAQMHHAIQQHIPAEPVRETRQQKMLPDGTWMETSATTNEDIHQHFYEYWAPILQMAHDETDGDRATGTILEDIARSMSTRLSKEEREGIEMKAILTAPNIRAAIARVKKGTSAGADGLPAELYQMCTLKKDSEEEKAMIDHLLELYRDIMERGHMPDHMRETTTTMVYKGDGPGKSQADPACYRPIAVTSVEYRILATAMAMKLAEVIHRLVGESQIGFQLARDIGENIDLMQEVMRYCNNEASARGGAIAILDNAHAFDYVAWPFMWKALAAYGLPTCFIDMLAAMMNGASTRLKVNGTLGPRINQTSGVIQGSPLSSLIYLLVIEVLLTMIRTNDNIHGIEIPGTNGADGDGDRATVKERGLADDVALYMTKLEQSIPALRETLERFRRMSGQRIKLSKSAVVLMGADAARPIGEGSPTDPQPLWPGMIFSTQGIVIAKYHGIAVTDEAGTCTHWERKVTEVVSMMNEDARVFTPRSVEGRAHLARGRYMGKAAYTFQYMVPEQTKLEELLSPLATRLKQHVLGVGNWIRESTAKQRHEDGGLELIDPHTTMRARWASAIPKLLDPHERPWKNFARNYLRRAYGDLLATGTRLLTANIGFHCVTTMPAGAITEKMRQAFRAYGDLPRPQPMQARAAEQSERARRSAAAPEREREIAFYVEREHERLENGVDARLPANGGWAPPTEQTQIETSLEARRPPWTIRLSADVRHALLESETPRAAGHRPTGRIAVVALDGVEGSLRDLSSASARARHQLTGKKWDAVDRLRPILVHGGAGAPPAVPSQAILQVIDTHELKASPVEVKADFKLRLKAIPPETLAALREAVTTHQSSTPETKPQDNSTIKTTWSRAQVLKQMALHSPHYRPAGRHAHRASEEEERRMIRWAAHGATTIADMLHEDETRVIEEEEFRIRWPGLAAESHVYAEIRTAIPKEWTDAIASASTSASIAEEAWWRDAHGAYWQHHTTQPEEEEAAPERLARRYIREEGTPRLRAAGDAMEAELAPPTADMCQCCVTAIALNPNARPDWVAGDANDLRRARDERWSHLATADTMSTAHEPLCEIGYRPKGLRERQVVAADSLNNKHVREMLASTRPQLPRAWDCREKDARYDGWYPGMAPTEYTMKVSKLFRDARHPCVPPRVHDVLYRILVSGSTNGWRATAQQQTCAKCDHPAMETVAHRYARCPPVAALWVEIIARWNASTGEELSALDPRTTMLGDRGDDAHALTETLWRVTHAATIWAIHQATKSAQDHPTHARPTAMGMLTATRKHVQRMISAAWDSRTTGATRHWKEWREAGWVVKAGKGGGRVTSRLLEGGLGAEVARVARRMATRPCDERIQLQQENMPRNGTKAPKEGQQPERGSGSAIERPQCPADAPVAHESAPTTEAGGAQGTHDAPAHTPHATQHHSEGSVESHARRHEEVPFHATNQQYDASAEQAKSQRAPTSGARRAQSTTNEMESMHPVEHSTSARNVENPAARVEDDNASDAHAECAARSEAQRKDAPTRQAHSPHRAEQPRTSRKSHASRKFRNIGRREEILHASRSQNDEPHLD